MFHRCSLSRLGAIALLLLPFTLPHAVVQAAPGDIAPPVLPTRPSSPNLALEVLDLGSYRFNGPNIRKIIEFTVPPSSPSYQITPPETLPFVITPRAAYLTANSNRTVKVEVTVRTSQVGEFNQVIAIKAGDQVLKRVRLKASVQRETKPTR